jgi:hypothetical protein
MPRRADHADTKQRHAHIVDLFLVTVNHCSSWLDRLSCLTASLWRSFGVGKQPVSVESRPDRLLLGRFSCQQPAECVD